MIPLGILASSIRATTGEKDPHWDNVVSLLHFDGVDGSTTISDDSGRSWTVLGAAQVDTAQSKFGSGSLLLNGSTALITAASTSDFGFGTGDFTVEAWVRRGAAAGNDCPIFEFRAAGAENGLFYLNPTTRRLAYYNGTVYGNTGSAPAQDTWAHVAFSRESGVLRAFLDGVKQWSFAMAGNFGASRACAIGSNFAGSSFFNGSIDEARITKGVARYTADFTPPDEPFPSQ